MDSAYFCIYSNTLGGWMVMRAKTASTSRPACCAYAKATTKTCSVTTIAVKEMFPSRRVLLCKWHLSIFSKINLSKIKINNTILRMRKDGLFYIWIFFLANPVDVLTWSSDVSCSTEHFLRLHDICSLLHWLFVVKTAGRRGRYRDQRVIYVIQVIAPLVEVECSIILSWSRYLIWSFLRSSLQKASEEENRCHIVWGSAQ